jgi:hypothetical protein
MKVVVPAITVLVLLATTQARSQMSTTSELPYHNPAAIQDPTDYGVRNRNAKMGRTIEDWARHLDDVDPQTGSRRSGCSPNRESQRPTNS